MNLICNRSGHKEITGFQPTATNNNFSCVAHQRAQLIQRKVVIQSGSRIEKKRQKSGRITKEKRTKEMNQSINEELDTLQEELLDLDQAKTANNNGCFHVIMMLYTRRIFFCWQKFSSEEKKCFYVLCENFNKSLTDLCFISYPCTFVTPKKKSFKLFQG